MRTFLLALLSLAFIGCASTPSAPISSVEIEEVKQRYMDEQQFMRISEYFSGAEQPGRRVILRSNPEERDGYYFVLVLDKQIRKLPKGTVIVGEFFTPVSPDVQVHEFILPTKRPATNEIFVGLTGADWPEPGGVSGAWRFTVKEPNGGVLAVKKSYLWSM